MSDWQPIETAPTNTSVLVYIPGADDAGPPIYRAILIDVGGGEGWMTVAWGIGANCGTVDPFLDPPTHWRPLPPPPEL